MHNLTGIILKSYNVILFVQIIVRTWNEYEKISNTFLSFELVCSIIRSNLWNLLGLNEKNRITFSRLIENHFDDLVHGL